MPKNLNIKLPLHVLNQIQAIFYKHFGLMLETIDSQGRIVPDYCHSGCSSGFCELIRSTTAGKKRCDEDRIRSLSIAIETGQPYITFCHAGIVLVCLPVMDGNTPLGGLIFGKCLFESPDEAVLDDIQNCTRDLGLGRQQIEEAVRELDVISGRRVHQAAEFLYIVLYEVSGLDPVIMQFRRRKSQQQAQISQFMHENKLLNDSRYPVEKERQLVSKVSIGDRTGAREILNSILGTLLLQYPAQMNVLKARMIELLSLISRAAVEGGGESDLLLHKNLEYINRIIRIASQEDLAAWISAALEEFTAIVAAAIRKHKATRLLPVLDYMRDNSGMALTLADLARVAHLSPSRLAHVFKEETGKTVVDYLTDLRMDRARQLLLTTERSCTDICFEAGYNNQSYFTRSFKEHVGMTPLQFRRQNKMDKLR